MIYQIETKQKAAIFNSVTKIHKDTNKQTKNGINLLIRRFPFFKTMIKIIVVFRVWLLNRLWFVATVGFGITENLAVNTLTIGCCSNGRQ